MSDNANQVVMVDIDDDGVIVVRGEVDMAAGPLLDNAIEARELDDPVVLDLGGVEFIDSSGLRRLLGASRRAAARGFIGRAARRVAGSRTAARHHRHRRPVHAGVPT